MKRYIRCTTKNHSVFDETTTNVSYYDNFLNAKDLDYMRKAKNLDGKIVMMTPDEYYREASKIFNNRHSAEDLVKQRSDKDTEEYVELMKSSTRFPLTYLNYANGGQEGLHRMLAAKKAFGPDVKYPVLVVTPYDTNQWKKDELWSKAQKFVNYKFRRLVDNLSGYLSYHYHFPPDNIKEVVQDYIDGEIEFCMDTYDDDDAYSITIVPKIEGLNDGDTFIELYVTEFNGEQLDKPYRFPETLYYSKIFDYEDVPNDLPEEFNGEYDDLTDEDMEELFKDDPVLYKLLFNNK